MSNFCLSYTFDSFEEIKRSLEYINNKSINIDISNPKIDEFIEILMDYRQSRQFDTAKILEYKAIMINEFMLSCGLSSVVVALSGGLDSAVVLAILQYASTFANSPIEQIIATNIPIFVTGSSNQSATFLKSYELVNHFNKMEHRTKFMNINNSKSIKIAIMINFECIDVTRAFDEQSRLVGRTPNPWSNGQLISTIRYPFLNSLVSDQYTKKKNCILVGTMNFDEGGYIGYMGKTSDLSVDLMIIADLHKHEVWKIGKWIGVTNDILNADPAGDLYNKKTDEEYIGAPYIMIELYMAHLMKKINLVSVIDYPIIKLWSECIEKMHSQASHKYFNNIYPLCLNIYESSVVHYNSRPIPATNSYKYFANPQHIYPENILTDNPKTIVTKMNLPNEKHYYYIENLLSKNESSELINLLMNSSSAWTPTPLDGYALDYKVGDKIGSYRKSFHSELFAKILWNRLKGNIPNVVNFNNSFSADCEECSIWKPIGINPYIRIIWYKDEDNYIIPHYDASTWFNNNDGNGPNGFNSNNISSTIKSMESLVIYLTSCSDGETRFLYDNQSLLPVNQMDLSDQTSFVPTEKEIYAKIKPESGNASAWEHYMLHDGINRKTGTSEYKLIFRTDIVYERCLPIIKAKTNPINYLCEGEIDRSDLYFSSAFETYNYETLVASGYYSVGRRPTLFNDRGRWIATPFGKLSRNLEEYLRNYNSYEVEINNKKLFVLLTSGCYAPLHMGHIGILELAKQYLESLGHIVLIAYIVPSNASYVTSKLGQDNAHQRLNTCQTFVKDISWIDIDPYEIMYETDDVRFTEICTRINVYVNKHVGSPKSVKINVAYVFGGDRAEFARAFVNLGYGICVKRQGYPIYDEMKKELDGNPNIFWVNNDRENLSSTDIRSGKKENAIDSSHTRSSDGNYYLRKEIIPDNVDESYNDFCEQLANVIRDSFVQNKVNVTFLDLGNIPDKLKQLNPEQIKNVISLDPFCPVDRFTHAFNISRQFDVCSYTQIGLIERPGFQSFEFQAKRIPPGNYILVDDDRVTGSTINFAKSILKDFNVNIVDTIFLFDDIKRIDIDDCRDFLIGSKYGGLVISLPNKFTARVPYILPYVFPSDRALIPVEQNLIFSKKLWLLNFEYYKQNPKTVENIDVATRRFLHYIGFVDMHDMVYVCAWHLMFFDHVIIYGVV
jgi:NAD+ synthetase